MVEGTHIELRIALVITYLSGGQNPHVAFYVNMKVMIGRVSFYGVRDSSRQQNMNIRTAIVFATADSLALHLQKQGSHFGCVSEVRFNSLKSSRDSSRQYSSKKMHPRQLFLRRVSIATGVRDSTTNENKKFKGFRPQLI